ncbi:MAG: helix-turn-helix domain-containing protein [Lachnospiraceae bacterium]|nr:helix-turn-helix domain-containing protein [Lachnospiraceae bacterium]
MDTKSLGNRIQQLREERGLTQEELATKTDISIKHISVLERGLKEPRLTTFLTIAEALDVTPNELLSAPTTESDYMSIISYKASQLSEEKQKSLLKIMNTLVEEL